MSPDQDAPTPSWAAIIAARMPHAATQRVRASRRLRQTGALAVRPGVYALPDSAVGREALAEAAQEVGRQRGSAMACVLSWLDPRDEERLRTRFERERSRKREQLVRHVEGLERALSTGSRLGEARRRTAHARLARLRKHLDRAPSAEAAVTPAEPRRALRNPRPLPAQTPYRDRTWATRKGVLVDRIASAWLIARFIDPEARFQFVSNGDAPAPGALRFDMAGAEFGHEGDRCTFETLVQRFRGDDPALRQLAEIVHDLDLRDGKFGRAEAPGVALTIAGLAAAESDDLARIRQGQWLFDCLYVSLRPGPTPRLPKGVLP